MFNKLDFSKEFIGCRAVVTGTSPEDLAEVVALLASERGKWMTGGIINVDGGMTAR